MDIKLEVEEDGEWSPNSHLNGRDLEAMQGWNCMVEGRLIRIDSYHLYKKDAYSIFVA